MNKTQINDFRIISFFRRDIWDFKLYPDEEIAKYFARKKYTVIDVTSIKGSQLHTDLKDIFTCIFANGELYTYKSKAFPSFFFLLEFMQAKNYGSFSEITDVDTASQEWLQFWADKGKVYLHDYRYVISKSIFSLHEFRDERSGLDRNYWRISDMKLNDERICKSTEQTVMNFWLITNTENRELVKLWFKYLIGGTELAYRTIYERFNQCVQFVQYIGDKSLLSVSHEDVTNYRIYKPMKSDQNNHFIGMLKGLYRYLIVKGYDCTIPVLDSHIMQNDYTHIYNSVSEFTILEIFKHIHKLPETYKLIFLIDLFTGMRISDICQLQDDCLYKSEHGYFIGHDVQKMQDTGGIPICKELYEMIMNRINYIHRLDYEETYLFPSCKKKNYPYNSGTYRRNMKKHMTSWGIKTADGDDYDFVTHAFRHTISTQLYNMGMPAALIQLGVLHHQAIDMSRHYIEITSDTHKKSMQKHSLNVASDYSISEISSKDAVLANGYCGMPAQLQCPNLNSCLTCQFFRTSLRFLDVHKQHLEKTNEQIKYYKNNNLEQNLSSALQIKENLELIIAKLEEIKEGEINDTNITTEG